MNKFGFNINWKNSPEEILKLGECVLADGTYGAIEITYYEDMEDVDTFLYNRAIRTIIAKYHPEVVVHVSAFNLSEENSVLRSAIFHEIENCLKYTANLGGRKMVIHGGFLSSGIHVPIVRKDLEPATSEDVYEKAWKLTVKMLRRACIAAKEYGITLYTENLSMIHLTTECTLLNRLIDEVGMDNLKIVFDIGHCHHTKHDIVSNVLEAGKRLGHLHLHDNFGEKDEHLPIGDGTIDYVTFAQALKKIDYKGLYMMELYHSDENNLVYSRERLLKCLE